VAMISEELNISLGNKIIGIISFASIVLLGLIFVLSYLVWETLIISTLLISVYSIQASSINYIRLAQGQFSIENIFKVTKKKDSSLFDEVTELIPFTHLMRIKFKDGSSYLFWGRSQSELNRSIKNAIT
jgi:hypothetical protein